MYEKEVVDQGKKVEKMKDENKDEYDIKKQVCLKLENKTIHSTVEALLDLTPTSFMTQSKDRMPIDNTNEFWGT